MKRFFSYSLRQDFYERFVNYDTANGLYLMGAGILIILAAIFYPQHAFTAFWCAVGWWSFSHGIRMVLVNPIKLAEKRERLLAKRMVRNAGKTL